MSDHTRSLLTPREARANQRDPYICPRCHDTKSYRHELCAACLEAHIYFSQGSHDGDQQARWS